MPQGSTYAAHGSAGSVGLRGRRAVDDDGARDAGRAVVDAEGPGALGVTCVAGAHHGGDGPGRDIGHHGDGLGAGVERGGGREGAAGESGRCEEGVGVHDC